MKPANDAYIFTFAATMTNGSNAMHFAVKAASKDDAIEILSREAQIAADYFEILCIEGDLGALPQRSAYEFRVADIEEMWDVDSYCEQVDGFEEWLDNDNSRRQFCLVDGRIKHTERHLAVVVNFPVDRSVASL